MSELRLKIRNKIYTSGNHIIDTRNNNNAIIVFLGKMSSDTLKPYVDNFLKDTLKSQIPEKKLCYVVVDGDSTEKLPQKIAEAIGKVEFNPTMKNELYISFVTLMDDDIYAKEQKIDVGAIEELKVSALGGFSVEFFYDFYGIFTSTAKYDNRLSARKTIVDFLSNENGGINIIKRVYHQACPGNDYYRSSKSVTFMILANLIGKLESHLLADCKVEGDSYTWTTFALFEKNLASLVIYEMVNKLLENQIRGTENVSLETMISAVTTEMSKLEAELKKISAAADINYIPVVVRKTERKLSAMEKAKNMFSKEKISTVEYRKMDEDISVNDLLEQQKIALGAYIEKAITEEYMDKFVKKLINMCAVMTSINNSSNEALVLKSMEAYKKEIEANMSKVNAPLEISDSSDYYIPKYNNLISSFKVSVLEMIIEYFKNHVDEYVKNIQEHWNGMNMEVSAMINDFAAFHSHFEGIGELLSDKIIPLMSTYDDILEKIDVQSVVNAIDRNTEIYSKILESYYDNVQAAGDIAKRFGNRNIVPDIDNTRFTLFSNKTVNCPNTLKSVVDEYWFRDHEIAILFTAKNNITDCNNLPFGV